VLTDAGLERLRSAARTHLRGIDRYFVSALSSQELATLERSMQSVSARAGADAGMDDDCASGVDGVSS
jgi:hypothetical protein